MERDNYLILLELPFDPPCDDGERIREAILRKKQEWMRLRDVPDKRVQALRYLEQIPDMEETLLNPTLREDEGKRAATLQEEMLRRFDAELRVLEAKEYLTSREAASIVVKYRPYGVTRESVEENARVPITDTPPRRKQDEEKPGEPITREEAAAIREHLTLLGKATLYDFLGEPPSSTLKKLGEAADARLEESTDESTASQAAKELAALCKEQFRSLNNKQRYDRYLQVSKYPDLNNLVEEEYARSGFVSPAALLRLVNFGVESYGLKVLEAEEAIRRYCLAYDIPVDNESPRIPCPSCGNRTDRDGAVCTICGAPLRGECPVCATPFEGGVSVCSGCGFSIAGMGEALRHISEAEAALIENYWSTAERALQHARRLWPGHPMIATLERRCATLEQRYAQYIDSINDSVEHNRYYAALELMEEAESRRIRLPRSTVTHVRGVITRLEDQIEELQRSGGAGFSTLHKLAASVADSIDLNRLMAEYPPEPPEGLSLRIKDRQAFLQWQPSPAVGKLAYVVVRKAGSPPLTAYDGEVVYEGPASSCTDENPPPLVEHYYSVYTRRGNAFSSQGCQAAPVRIVPELEELRILPVDGGALLSWEFNPDVREVRIWRKLGGERPSSPGDGIQLETDRLDGFWDRKIRNDVEYWYYVVAVYELEGRKVASEGVCDSVVPHRIVAPVDSLAIIPTGEAEDEYVVSWEEGEHPDVILLTSQEKPSCHSGDMLPIADLLARYRRLNLHITKEGGARFRHSFHGGLYVFAAVVYGRYATVGRACYLTNVRPPSNAAYDKVEGNLLLHLEWPRDVSQVVAAYRFDRFPTHPEENGTSLLPCARDQFDYDGGILLREPERTVYYIKLFSVFSGPDGSKSYSEGVELLVDNNANREIYYQLEYKKPLFGEGKINLTLHTAGEYTLSQLVLVGKIGRLPLKQTDGMPLFEIGAESRMENTITFEYRTEALPKHLFVRLFWRDESLCRKNRLLPVSSMKLS